jgi:hypothetical protein
MIPTQLGTRPQQYYGYGTVAGAYPAQTDIFSSMMPMFMMIIMMAMIMPMMKGFAGQSS